jgi:serine/threonine protein kinase/WD40 repeat protein
LAADIRDLFPGLLLMEDVRPPAVDATGSFVALRGGPDRLGDYRLLREIGQGGMGVVYEAEQMSLGRHVALKVLPGHGLMNSTFLERFRREAKAAARLHHTNIVPVYGVGEGDGVHFYAMQFIKGQSLDQVLHDLRRLRTYSGGSAGAADPTVTAFEVSVAQGLLTGQFALPPADGVEKSETPTAVVPPPAPAEQQSAPGLSAGGSESQYFRSVARVGLQAAEALAYAHRHGILHRDIKPSNLLLDQQGTIWITDFGLAKAEGADELTHTGDIVGTIRFMAPERFDGQSLPQSDVYSLGLTLYEMLTLRPAFHDANRTRLIEKVLHEPPVPPRKIDPHVPRDLETIVLKCLAKEVASRYATAEELAEDLRRFLADRTIRARRAGYWEQTWRWCRRNPAVASLLTAVAALLVAVAVVSALYAVHQKASATKLAGALTEARLSAAEAFVGQAHGTRHSRRPGQRLEALAALDKAAAIGRELEQPPEWFDRLRTEAIAALALPDVEVLREWEGLPAGTASIGLDFDGNLERYSRLAADGTVSVRRVRDDAEIARWQEQTEGVWPLDESNLRFSPDGRFLCIRHSASGRLTVRRLDGPEPTLFHRGTKACTSWAMDFSPDIKRLAYLQRDTRIVVVNLTSGQVHSLPPTGRAGQDYIRFCPDGRRFAIRFHRMGTSTVDVRDTATGHVLGSFSHPTNAHHPAWHPDGRTLATCCDDHLIRLWETTSGRLLQVLKGHETQGMGCAFTLGGDRLVSNDWNGLLRIWEPSSGRQLLTFPAGGYSILRVGSDDRVTALRAADSKRLQLLRLYTGLEYRTIGLSGNRRRGNFHSTNPKVHPRGRLLAVSNTDGSVVLIDLDTGREVAALPGPPNRTLLWEPSGDLLTHGVACALRWPVRTDPVQPARYCLGPPEQILPFKSGDSWSSSANGQILAIPQNSGGAIVVHRGPPSRTIRLQPQQDVRHCAVSPDRHWVATGSHNNTDGFGVKVWDAATGELAKAFRVAGFCDVHFSPDGHWLLTTSGGCRLWEVGSWKEGPKVGGGTGCFSPDGQFLAVEDSVGAIRLVRTESGKELARLESPEQTRLIPCCFTPDGTRLIAIGIDTRALHVWDLRRIRKELVRLGLDWDAPPYPETADRALEPIEVQVVGAELVNPKKK